MSYTLGIGISSQSCVYGLFHDSHLISYGFSMCVTMWTAALIHYLWKYLICMACQMFSKNSSKTVKKLVLDDIITCVHLHCRFIEFTFGFTNGNFKNQLQSNSIRHMWIFAALLVAIPSLTWYVRSIASQNLNIRLLVYF